MRVALVLFVCLVVACGRSPTEEAPVAHEAKRDGFIGIEYLWAEDLATVVHVLLETPAERAGIRENDVLLFIDGQVMTDAEAPSRVITRATPGELIPVVIARDTCCPTAELTTLRVRVTTWPRELLDAGLRDPDDSDFER